MSDISSGLPLRSQLPGQANYDDVVVKLGDGVTSSQLAAVNAAGSVQVHGEGTAGSPAGGVVSVQGIASGTAVAVSGTFWQTTQPVSGTVTANQGSPNTAANAWYVHPSDGTNSQSYTAAGEAKVDITVALPTGSNVIGAVTQSGGPWSSNITQIAGSALALGQTTMSASLPVTIASNQSALAVSQSGSWTVAATQSGTWTVGLSEDHNFGTVGSTTLRTAAQIGNATGAADFNNGATGAQTLRVAANLSVAGANVSSTNPVPVVFSSAPLGTPINDYKVASAIAASASDNHDYSITSLKTLNLKMIWASASGLMKAEVQISPDGSVFTTKFVGFNSTANANIYIQLDELVVVESGTGSKIRVICTNLDKKSQDLYSTISGIEV